MLPKNYFIWLVIIFVLFIIDRITKELVILLNPASEGFFYFSYQPNTNLVFGLPLPAWLILLISFLALIIVAHLIMQAFNKQQERLVVAASFLMIGGISNFYDRLTGGRVIDFIHLWIFPVFNLADLYLLIGLILLLKLAKKGIYAS
ncbi:MAG: signal peptidase II [Patescibacteria group bacterium]